ncbi:MAG: Asp-tRNA(Asn)/Glu-tRNA(Gln) amidotransferase GatCAB subunit B, partial [Polaromonas sp.]|nr:Asp-tRNA(Asn)/Glu-tRNA(Gln) amidotransferase GatCAB subunit B [Polaromonas sp.]
FDPDTGETRAMRSKEDAADYRYFPDPDLPPLVIGRDWVERTRSEMSELPRVMAARFVVGYGLSEYDAGQLTQSKAIAAYFEVAAKTSGSPKFAANWVLGEVSALLNRLQVGIDDVEVPLPTALGELIRRILDNTISHAGAKTVFQEMCERIHGQITDLAKFIENIIESKGLKQISDSGELEKIIDDVLAANAKNVEEIKAGNTKAMNALVGQAMKATKGKANPAQVNELLKKKIG